MKTLKQLLEDIQTGYAPKEISYKGYTTKNLHHVPDATKAFQATITRVEKGTLEDNGEVLDALKNTDTYMKLNDMHLEQEKDLDPSELQQWLKSHEAAKQALTKIGEFEHHYDYWNSHNTELQFLKANQNMPQETESVQESVAGARPTRDELASRFQFTFNRTPAGKAREVARNREELKRKIKAKKASGGLAGPKKGQLPEEVELEEAKTQNPYHAGYAAHGEKKTRQHNPYKEGSEGAAMWAKGWEHASDGKPKAKFTNENFGADFLAMARQKNPNARLVTPEQKKKEAEELAKKRADLKPAHAAPTSNPRPLGGYDPKSNRSYSEEVEGVTEMDNRTPSGDRREKRNNSPEAIAHREKEQQKRLKSISPEMRKKLRLPEPKEGVAEGDVVQFPKKHPYELLTNCPKCGGPLQGGKDEKGRLKLCMPCMNIYRAPNQQGVAEGVEQVEEAVKKKLMIGSKVSHPVHGKGTVVSHSLGGGTMGTVVKFADGKKVRVDHKKLKTEEVELEEKTLTPAELKKREEIAKAMERKNPNMDKSRKMAIATAVAKRVAEQHDDAE
jgi:hypothetical protein